MPENKQEIQLSLHDLNVELSRILTDKIIFSGYNIIVTSMNGAPINYTAHKYSRRISDEYWEDNEREFCLNSAASDIVSIILTNSKEHDKIYSHGVNNIEYNVNFVISPNIRKDHEISAHVISCTMHCWTDINYF